MLTSSPNPEQREDASSETKHKTSYITVKKLITNNNKNDYLDMCLHAMTSHSLEATLIGCKVFESHAKL